ncbi:MAG: T9SS type A sorting domain-containing protein [Microscillaceae bacterium]|nr:T9SS type A sorting domain-containing protein [Microscillaceae bacterium]MDW8461270.1 T9SS type A sorting domain-containing protein [Cytophagales bacterium]
MKHNYSSFAQNMSKSLFTFVCTCFVVHLALASNPKVTRDSLLAIRLKKEKSISKIEATTAVDNKEIKIIKTDNPIIVRRGEPLVINMSDQENFYQVRIHTTLGRLMKRYTDVRAKITIHTDLWETGIYTVVISNATKREIRKVLITE